MNLKEKKCEECGGQLVIARMDANRIYFVCKNCSTESEHVFQSEEESEYYREDELQQLFGKLRRGFLDWQLTNWERLYKDFVDLINKQNELETDLRVQMALVACVTKAFHLMNSENYQQSKMRFKIVDKMYKHRLKVLRAQMKNPVLSNSMQDYQASRTKYVQLRNQYLQTKMVYKMFWSILKKFLK
jgi:hypothetical protein